MPKLSTANKLAKDLEDYVDSPIIRSISFSVDKPVVNIHFKDGIRIKLPFTDEEYEFTDEIIIHDKKKMLSNETVITKANQPTLVFMFNLFENQQSGSFIFMCEQYIRDLWVRDL
jgi:hypothetical protein